MLNSADIQEFTEEVLANFSSVPNPVALGQLKVEYKESCIRRAQSTLSQLNDDNSIPEDILFALLKGFRMMCREAEGCETLVSQETIDLLWLFGNVDATSDASKMTKRCSIESLKCLANVQVILPSIRALFSEYEKLPTIVSALKLPNHTLGSAFLLLRLLFFASATKTSLGDSFVADGVLDVLSTIIEKCRDKSFQDEEWISCDTVISECIKTGFNVTIGSSPIAVSMFSFTKSIVELTPKDEASKKYYKFLASIIQIFLDSKLGSPPLSSPHHHIINAMMNIPVADPSIWFPDNDYTLLNILLDIFEVSFKEIAPEMDAGTIDTYCDSPIDQAMIPLCVVLKKLAVIPEAAKRMKARLAPPNINRAKSLSEGSHLTAALIRTMTSVVLSQTRDFVCELLLSCFENDVERFVHYVGYANAAGYLFTKGIASPQAAGVASSSSDSKSGYSKDGIPENVDPMTGRFREEKPDPLAGMTDEEKEREAERLFVLLDRLNKTGVIKMQPK